MDRFAVMVLSCMAAVVALMMGIGLLYGYLCLHSSARKYEKKGKSTTAKLVEVTGGPDEKNGKKGSTPRPVLAYFDEFAGVSVTRPAEMAVPVSFMRKGARSGTYPIGETMRVQYLPRRVRICDERYIKPRAYEGKGRLTGAIICGALTLMCVIVMLVAMVMS